MANCCEHNELSEVEWVSHRERRPAFFAGRNSARVLKPGRERPPSWTRPLVQAAAPGVVHAPAASVRVRLNECGIAPVESLEPTLTKTTTMSVACTRSRSAQVGHHVHDPGAVLVAVNASALRADRDAASGIDRSCAQRVFRIYVMADFEWLTLTRDFCEAYSAGISLVS